MAEIRWLTSLDEGFEQATSTGRPVLVDFTAAPT